MHQQPAEASNNQPRNHDSDPHNVSPTRNHASQSSLIRKRPRPSPNSPCNKLRSTTDTKPQPEPYVTKSQPLSKRDYSHTRTNCQGERYTVLFHASSPRDVPSPTGVLTARAHSRQLITRVAVPMSAARARYSHTPAGNRDLPAARGGWGAGATGCAPAPPPVSFSAGRPMGDRGWAEASVAWPQA